jgi:hypothetical protein
LATCSLHDWWSWTARELRRLLADPDARADWHAARAALPDVRAYEARLRRLLRAVGLNGAGAAYHAASDAVCDLSRRVADAPARSLNGLAVKARVVKRHAAPTGGARRARPRPARAGSGIVHILFQFRRWFCLPMQIRG